MASTACIVCRAPETEIVFRWEGFPLFVYPLPVEIKKKVRAVHPKTAHALEITYCQRCTHFFQTDRPPFNFIEELYSKYYFYPSPLETRVSNTGADLFIQKLLPFMGGYKKVLELGCFDGYLIYNLMHQHGYEVMGCDPSRGSYIGKKFGLEIKNTYFNRTIFPEKSFDVVIFRHLIEHLPDPSAFLQDVRSVVRDNGMIAIETPNCEYDLENGSFRPFHHEHVSNFTMSSLRFLLQKNGFIPVHAETTPDNIILFARKGAASVPSQVTESQRLARLGKEFNARMEANRTKLRGLVESLGASAGRGSGEGAAKLVVWGAGGFTAVLLALSGIEKHVGYIVDSDQGKWGCEYLDFGVSIRSPAELSSEQASGKAPYILIGSQYTDEIVAGIRAMKLKSRIITVHPEIRMLD